MSKPTIRRVAALAAAGLALTAGGGAAIAATSGDERDAFLGDVAKRLGVQPSALEDAIEEASKARVDDAVDDGRLTEEQAERIKERIEEGGGPTLGGPGLGIALGFGSGHAVHLDLRAVHRAAATYLGMTERQLMTAQRNGTSLADLAERRDKAVAGLRAAMRAAAEKAFAQAVADGDLTDADRDRMLERIDEHLEHMIEATPPRFRGGPPGPGHRFEVRPGTDEEEGAVFLASERADLVL